jgi:hypothetical protein
VWPGGWPCVDESKLDVPKNRLQQTPAFRLALGEADLVARSEWLFICKVVEAVYAAKARKGTFGAKSF